MTKSTKSGFTVVDYVQDEPYFAVEEIKAVLDGSNLDKYFDRAVERMLNDEPPLDDIGV